MRIDVVPTVEAAAPSELAGVVVLVVDVLRASTTMITALANGCVGIVPVADPDDARSWKDRLQAVSEGETGLTGHVVTDGRAVPNRTRP